VLVYPRSDRAGHRPGATGCPAGPGGNALPVPLWPVSAQVSAVLAGAGAGGNRAMAGAAAPFAVQGVAGRPRPGRQLPARASLLH